MKLFTRQAETGLNVLQALFDTAGIQTVPALCERLAEQEVFMQKVMGKLKDEGYVVSIRGNTGGYRINPLCLNRPLRLFLESFGREYIPNAMLDERFASEAVFKYLVKQLEGVTLRSIFMHCAAIQPPEPPRVA